MSFKIFNYARKYAGALERNSRPSSPSLSLEERRMSFRSWCTEEERAGITEARCRCWRSRRIYTSRTSFSRSRFGSGSHFHSSCFSQYKITKHIFTDTIAAFTKFVNGRQSFQRLSPGSQARAISRYLLVPGSFFDA